MHSVDDMSAAWTVLRAVRDMDYEEDDLLDLETLETRIPAGTDFEVAVFVVGRELGWYRPTCVAGYEDGWDYRTQEDWILTSEGAAAMDQLD